LKSAKDRPYLQLT